MALKNTKIINKRHLILKATSYADGKLEIFIHDLAVIIYGIINKPLSITKFTVYFRAHD